MTVNRYTLTIVNKECFTIIEKIYTEHSQMLLKVKNQTPFEIGDMVALSSDLRCCGMRWAIDFFIHSKPGPNIL